MTSLPSFMMPWVEIERVSSDLLFGRRFALDDFSSHEFEKQVKANWYHLRSVEEKISA